MIRWQGQASLPLEEALARVPAGPLHPDESAAAAGRARSGPSLAVRLLAKELVLQALAELDLDCPPEQIAILPFGAPPRALLPIELPAGFHLHLSLSHSTERVMALVVLWQDDPPADSPSASV